MTTSKSPLFLGTVAKTMQLMQILASRKQPMSLSALARESGFTMGTIQRITFTLEELGYLDRDPENKLYSLSPKNLHLAHGFLATHPLLPPAIPILSNLHSTLNETVNLTQLDGPDIVYLARLPGSQTVAANLHIGARLPALLTAGGRAIISTFAEQERSRFIAEHKPAARTAHSITRPQELKVALGLAREQGFAIVAEEIVLGDLSIGTPVTDAEGRGIAAVSLSVPLRRWSQDKAIQELGPLIRNAANLIGQLHGS